MTDEWDEKAAKLMYCEHDGTHACLSEIGAVADALRELAAERDKIDEAYHEKDAELARCEGALSIAETERDKALVRLEAALRELPT